MPWRRAWCAISRRSRRSWRTAPGPSPQRPPDRKDPVMSPPPLTRDEFLAAPAATVASVAPTTAIWAPGGSRRRAVLEGIPLDETYPEGSRRQMLDGMALFFDLGVRKKRGPCRLASAA